MRDAVVCPAGSVCLYFRELGKVVRESTRSQTTIEGVKMKTSATVASLMIALFCSSLAEQTLAQGFGAAQVRRFSANNSASRFSSNQIRGQINNRGYGTAGVIGVNARTFGNAFNSVSTGAKPFQGLNRGPAVTPYLGLSNSFNGVSDYYNIVRPQQEFQRARNQQQRTNEITQQRLASQQHRLNQMAARPPFDIRGDGEISPTGHGFTYMSFTNFQSTAGYFSPIQGLQKQQ